MNNIVLPMMNAYSRISLANAPAAGDSLNITAARIFCVQLECLAANLPGLLSDRDVEHAHKFRVALRRLRCALRIFEALIKDTDYQCLREDLSRLADKVGEVRNADIVLKHIRRDLLKDKAIAAKKEVLLRVVDGRRKRDIKKMIAALRSRRLKKAVSTIDGIVDSLLRAQDNGEHVSCDYAAFILAKAFKVLKKKGKKDVGRFKSEKAHELRLAVKRARYVCEFFYHYYGKNIKSAIEALVVMQKLLGGYNDCQVTVDYLRRHKDKIGKGIFKVVKKIEYNRSAKLLRAAGKAWDKVPLKIQLR